MQRKKKYNAKNSFFFFRTKKKKICDIEDSNVHAPAQFKRAPGVPSRHQWSYSWTLTKCFLHIESSNWKENAQISLFLLYRRVWRCLSFFCSDEFRGIWFPAIKHQQRFFFFSIEFGPTQFSSFIWTFLKRRNVALNFFFLE